MQPEDILGTWRLLYYEARSEDGEVSYPGGREQEGYLIYSPDGYFAVLIMKKGRPRFSSDDFRGGTVSEKAGAAETFVAYCGTYSVGDGCVIHHIEASLFPNWVGTDQLRFIEIEGDRLVLTSPPLLVAGKTQTAYLVWERAVPQR